MARGWCLESGFDLFAEARDVDDGYFGKGLEQNESLEVVEDFFVCLGDVFFDFADEGLGGATHGCYWHCVILSYRGLSLNLGGLRGFLGA